MFDKSTLFKEDDPPKEMAKKCLAEFLGTAVLLYVGCSAGQTVEVSPSYGQLCYGFGFAATIALSMTVHISGGHINPAVTLASVVCGQKSLLTALWYTLSQMLGAAVGYGVMKAITPLYMPSYDTDFCVTNVSTKLTVLEGFLVEVLATSMLVMMACAAMDPRNAGNVDLIPVKFGLAVFALCVAFVQYTGCSMNPARSFGPALVNNNWRKQWLYWCAPLTGSILSSVIYQVVFMPSGDALP